MKGKLLAGLVSISVVVVLILSGCGGGSDSDDDGGGGGTETPGGQSPQSEARVSPYEGHWVGRTDQGYRFAFDVVSDYAEDITFTGNATGISLDGRRVQGSISISNITALIEGDILKQMSLTLSATVGGRFVSETQCTGSWGVLMWDPALMAGNGTWSATRQ